MKILVYGINYSPELTGIGKYTGEMVEWLAAQGHEVRVITAPPYYPQWQVGENYSAWRYKREEGAATVWRCPLYVPKQPSTLKRLLHLGSFAVSSFFPLMAQRRWKPDRIIGVVPTLFCTPGKRLLAKLSGARTVLHIFRITKWTPCWGYLAGKRQRWKWHSWQRRSNVVDRITSITSPRFRVQ